MQRTLLRSKLHRVTCTHAELDYEGSIAIDGRLLDAADIREYERVDVYNRRNGERFSTYAIRAQEGSGIISVNGAAAHKASPGDLLIICAYGVFEEKELAGFKPRLVYVDADNRITHTRHAIPVQVA
ncbi:MAG TPA: aspartate 1-decarboxylase [Acidiferrobacterales bacterium]|jgi:aspartate 1-decarboxylase|nr:aspartate 1-decarboxylase [Acidiferrobacterales bacterium]HWR86905.1 aspartate 1-decarboxylase [Acidiferrobacterales bacterium]